MIHASCVVITIRKVQICIEQEVELLSKLYQLESDAAFLVHSLFDSYDDCSVSLRIYNDRTLSSSRILLPTIQIS